MKEALATYLSEVLGIERVSSSQASVVVLTEAPTPEQSELLAKMLAAIGIDANRVVYAAEPGPGVGLIFSDQGLGEGLAAGSELTRDGRRYMKLSPLRDLQIGSAAEIQARKRETWNYLQRFRQWLGMFVLLAISSLFVIGNAAADCTAAVQIGGAIGPANVDLLERTMNFAKDRGCSSVLLLINTPGGSLQSTRLMVEQILNSPIPILCLVAPSGGHAGSAGAILLQACHVNGALKATNLGAATPIAPGGAELGEDLRNKLVNDTRSWVEGLTRLRGRSQKFAAKIVTEAKAVSAEEGKQIGAIDVVADDVEGFLAFASGRDVKLAGDATTKVQVGKLVNKDLDWRYRALDLLTDPQTAYLLLMGSLALIYFEVTHPGVMAPGVLGGIGLIISLVSLHKLNVEWGGLALIALAIFLMIAEVFVPSFGILGIGAIVSFVLGSLFLFDPVATGGYQLPLVTVFGTAALFALIMLFVGYLLWQTRKVKKRGGYDDMLAQTARVVAVADHSATEGQIEVAGETWRYRSRQPLRLGEEVRITAHEGFTLIVEPLKEN